MSCKIAPKPALKDFPTLESYLEALVDWKFAQRKAADMEWLRDCGVDPEGVGYEEEEE